MLHQEYKETNAIGKDQTFSSGSEKLLFVGLEQGRWGGCTSLLLKVFFSAWKNHLAGWA